MKKPQPGSTRKPPPDSDSNPLKPHEIVGVTVAVLVLLAIVVRLMRPPRKVVQGLAPVPSDDQLGKYRLGELLADGGTATVYRGYDEDGNLVAIKIPHLDQLSNRDFVATFQREAEIGLELRHPSIVRVFAVGSYDVKGYTVPYFVMEFLDGQELVQLIESGGPLPPSSALQVARGVADALQWAHQRGVVHRDISPRNIFITSKKAVKVMDFGISGVSTRFNSRSGKMKALSFGTPDYLAPERSQDRTSADARSDLYALGCVMFEMLTGRPPYLSEQPAETLTRHRQDPLPPLPYPELEALVHKLMAKNPKARFQTAGEVTSALAELVQTA